MTSHRLAFESILGKQKKQFETYESLIKGLSIEGYLQGSDSSHWSWAPGFGMTNRTLDDASMNNLLATLGTLSTLQISFYLLIIRIHLLCSIPFRSRMWDFIWRPPLKMMMYCRMLMVGG
ncbi:MAG: hypothetical protein IPF93_14580 [Saprospiraceae bacterium]|nr:hypothetical protein [Saprospiraceae bacterium]